MELDPIIVTLAGAVTTLAGIVYRLLIARAERAERGEEFWRGKALLYLGMSDLASENAEKRSQP